jgi:TonB family protein
VSSQFTDPSDYLDACAELAWDLIVKPGMDRAKLKLLFKPKVEMSYVREALVEDLMREYRINLNGKRGAAHIFTKGSQTYIVAAYGAGASDANVATFLESFAVKKPEVIGTETGGRVHNIGGGGFREYGEPGTPCWSEYDRDFSAKEVTRRAKVHARPEPVYTEWARKFSVTGTVRLAGVLNRDGTVTGIRVLEYLPHGLTRRAIEAMRQIKFEPAEKDGCKVSQYVRIDYNFSIY